MPTLMPTSPTGNSTLADAIARLLAQAAAVRQRMGPLGQQAGTQSPDMGAMSRISAQLAATPKLQGGMGMPMGGAPPVFNPSPQGGNGMGDMMPLMAMAMMGRQKPSLATGLNPMGYRMTGAGPGASANTVTTPQNASWLLRMLGLMG